MAGHGAHCGVICLEAGSCPPLCGDSLGRKAAWTVFVTETKRRRAGVVAWAGFPAPGGRAWRAPLPRELTGRMTWVALSEPARPSVVRRAVTLWLPLYCQGFDGSAPRSGDGGTRVAGGWGWTPEPTSARRGPARNARSCGEQSEGSQPGDGVGVLRWRMPILYANVRRYVASRVGNDSVSCSLSAEPSIACSGTDVV